VENLHVSWVLMHISQNWQAREGLKLGDTSSLEFMRGRRIFEINPDHPIVKDNDLNVKAIPDPSQFINH
jgi:hypothetical protein